MVAIIQTQWTLLAMFRLRNNILLEFNSLVRLAFYTFYLIQARRSASMPTTRCKNRWGKAVNLNYIKLMAHANIAL